MKRRSLALLLCAASMAAALLLLEVGIRMIYPAFDPSGHLRLMPATGSIPTLGPSNTTQRLVKNTGDFDVSVRFNRHGFRDEKDLSSLTSADYLVVGDSFSFGWGVEEHERYASQLDSLLDNRVFNAAMPGARLQDYRLLSEYAHGIAPDVRRVIIGVCMENDLTAGEIAGSPAPRQARTGARTGSFRAWLKSHSATYFMLTCVVHQHSALRDFFARLGLVIPVLDGMPRNTFSTDLITSSVAELEHVTAGYDATILIIPSRALWVGGHEQIEDRLHSAFVFALQEKGLKVVDLRASLEAEGRPLDYYFRHDGHWNAEGHGLAARALHNAIMQLRDGRASK